VAHLGLPTARPEISSARAPPQVELVDDCSDPDFGDAEFDDN